MITLPVEAATTPSSQSVRVGGAPLTMSKRANVHRQWRTRLRLKIWDDASGHSSSHGDARPNFCCVSRQSSGVWPPGILPAVLPWRTLRAVGGGEAPGGSAAGGRRRWGRPGGSVGVWASRGGASGCLRWVRRVGRRRRGRVGRWWLSHGRAPERVSTPPHPPLHSALRTSSKLSFLGARSLQAAVGAGCRVGRQRGGGRGAACHGGARGW